MITDDIRPTAVQRQDDGEFVDLGWRLVFKEHVNREGVPFDRRAMERIAERCNERIKEDGDFCPIAIRHTQDDGSFDPEVVGFAGPYKAQRLPGSKPRWGIYARWRVYKQDADKVRKYPRCSVEYWADKDDPTNGYFDPISMLGAETPELDLGIHYAADPHHPGRTLMRYQRVVEEGSGSLSPESIQQIIAALSPVIKQAVIEQVEAMRPKPPETKAKGKTMTTQTQEPDQYARQYVRVDSNEDAPLDAELAQHLARESVLAARRERKKLDIVSETRRILREFDLYPQRYAKAAAEFHQQQRAEQRTAEVARYSKQAQTEMADVAAVEAEEAVRAARREGKKLNFSGEMRRIIAEYEASPARYSKAQGQVARYGKFLVDYDALDKIKPAPQVTQGWVAFGVQANALGQKRYDQKRARGESANLAQERLLASREIMAAVMEHLKTGRAYVPDDVSEYVSRSYQPIATRASELAAKRVRQAKAAGRKTSFRTALHDALDELTAERDRDIELAGV